MFEPSNSTLNEAEELLLNAELRNDLEPYFDEAITRVNVHHLPLCIENEFLASMLAWETAPVLPIYRWFEPELRLPMADSLDDEQLRTILYDIIEQLHEKKIVLDFTDHLTDRELYVLIYRDILPAREKKLDLRNNYIHWDCSHAGGDPSVWLKYYASDDERFAWAEAYHQPLPPKLLPIHQRDMPQNPF